MRIKCAQAVCNGAEAMVREKLIDLEGGPKSKD